MTPCLPDVKSSGFLFCTGVTAYNCASAASVQRFASRRLGEEPTRDTHQDRSAE